jgi:hypothetical protein
VYHIVTVSRRVSVKKLVVLTLAVAAGLLFAASAQAGCMATVGLSSTPKAGIAAGEPWFVTIRVLQHGVRPMPDATPEVRIKRAGASAPGKTIVFKTSKTLRVGSYRAKVVFPRAGTYTLGVYDGFPVKECAQVHTFNNVIVAPAGD